MKILTMGLDKGTGFLKALEYEAAARLLTPAFTQTSAALRARDGPNGTTGALAIGKPELMRRKLSSVLTVGIVNPGLQPRADPGTRPVVGHTALVGQPGAAFGAAAAESMHAGRIQILCHRNCKSRTLAADRLR
jgi:hypothetical protein